MTTYTLTIELLTDTTFGSGESVAGFVDQEITYVTATGLPYIRGRVLKGLLVESCADILYALERNGDNDRDVLVAAAKWLFGTPGSDTASMGHLHVGTGQVKDADELAAVIRNDQLTAADVLDAYTVIRRQTSVDESTYGAPEKGSLRSARAVRRETVFMAVLTLDDAHEHAEALLAACVAGVRHAGSGRNRGRGEIRMTLGGSQQALLEQFGTLVGA